MKNISPALAAILASRQFYMIDLYQFQLLGGDVLRYCSGDKDIVFDGNTYSAGGSTGPYMPGNGNNGGSGTPLAHWKAGLEVDNITFDVNPGNAMIGDQTFQSAVRLGFFDAADVTIYRCYMQTYGDVSAGAVILFNGRVIEITPCGGSFMTFNVGSWVELLNMQLPRNLYQPSCVNTLGDTACTIDLNSLAVSGTVASGSTISTINASLSQASGYFTFGKIAFTSGDNDGQQRGIRLYTHGSPSTIALLEPVPSLPVPGDTFTIYPGCDKAVTTCQTKFANLRNFRGFPFIPQNSTAV